MRRNGVFVFIAAGLLLAGLVVLWLGSGRDSDAGDAAAVVGRAATGAAEGAAAALPASRAHDAAPESASLEELQPAAVAAPPAAVPASYLKALGGLTGRVMEHVPGDAQALRPVAALKIELAGGRKSSIMRPRDALLDPAALAPEFILGSTLTDNEGRFTLEHIDPRTMGVLLLDPGGPRGLFWPLEVTPTSGETNDLGDLVLPATATLFGLVVDERGAPVSGARVRCTDLPLPETLGGVAEFRSGGGVVVSAEVTDGLGDVCFVPPPSLSHLEARLPLPTDFTDAEGQFELTGVPPGLVLLAVDDGVHLPLARSGVPTGAAGGRRDVGSLTVGDGLPLAVTVRSSKGEALPKAQVLAGSPLPGTPISILKTPKGRGANGAAQFSGMAAGQGWIAARADERHAFTVLAVPDVAQGEATITLPVPHKLTLTVLESSGTPVTAAAFFGRAIKENETPDLVFPPIALTDRVQADPDAPGRFVLSELEPTLWEITTIVAGHPQHRVNVDLTGGDASAEVRVEPGLAASVRVVAAGNGTPIEYAMVEAFPEDDAMELRIFDGPASAVRTDATGLARFDVLPAGPVKFTVHHPGFAVTQGETALPSDDELRIELAGGGSIAGQVLDHGVPPAERLIVMLVPDDGTGDAELPRFVITDADGRFRFARVEAGSVELQARSRMEVGAGMSLFETMFNSPLAEAEVEVTDNTEAEVLLQVGGELDGVETGYVSGQLTVNGAPASGWKIRTWGRIRRSVATDEGGRFDLGRLAVGEVDLMISAPSQNMANGFTEQVEVTLAADERKWVPIELTTGAVSGHVYAAKNGLPLAGVEVTAAGVGEGEEGGWNRQPATTSAADGSFTIEPVVSGTYRIRARSDGYAAASSESIEVASFQTRSGLVLRLAAALAVSGTISFEGTQEKPEWMWLMATGGEDGEVREGARVDEDKMAFSFERLGPGDWEFELNSSLDVEFEPVKLTLTGDMTNLPLVFKVVLPDAADATPQGGAFVYEVK